MALIARRLSYIDSSDFRAAMKKQSQLIDPVNLSIGVPEELTPVHVKAAGIRAIESDKTTYTPVNGILQLREEITLKLKAENDISASPDCITVVPGLTTGQFLVYSALLDPGDEVIIFDPYFPPYVHIANFLEARPVILPTAPSFQPDPAALEAAITDRTKIIMINSPNNPSGAVYSEKTLRSIAEIAACHNIVVVSDEIYEQFVFDGKHFSIGSIYPNTLTMNGFSKGYAMTGWRCGYIHGPQEIIDAINDLSQYVVFSNSSIAQHAALEALRHPKVDISDKYRAKRDYVVRSLTEAGYEVEGAQGSFYVLVKTPHNMTDIEFIDRATERGLIVVPGRAFSQLHGYFRISYGANMETLRRGMKILEELSQA